MQNLITLSLCGKIYKVEKHILERSPYFKDIFDEYANSEKELGELYIPRPSIAFDHILAYLIYNGEYKVPEQFDQDMKYFCLIKVKEENIIKKKPKIINYKGYDFNISDEDCLKYGFKHGDEIILHDPNDNLSPDFKNKKAKIIGIRIKDGIFVFDVGGNLGYYSDDLKDVAKLAN